MSRKLEFGVEIRVTVEDKDGNLKPHLRRTDQRLWPAVESTAEAAVEEAKGIVRRKVKHPEWQTHKLEESITIGWRGKAQNRAIVGADLNVAPYAEYVEAGHYFSEKFARWVGWGWRYYDTERAMEWLAKHRRTVGYWFIRDGTKAAILRAQPYLEQAVVKMVKYRVGPRGGVYDAGLRNGELKVYRNTL